MHLLTSPLMGEQEVPCLHQRSHQRLMSLHASLVLFFCRLNGWQGSTDEVPLVREVRG